MSDSVTLTLRSMLSQRVALDGLTPNRCADLSAAKIAALPARIGSTQVPLGDLFAVAGEHSPQLRIEGDLSKVDGIGAGTAGGELIVDGPAGHRVAAGMTGGLVHVRGDAGDDAGMVMSGGVLRIDGDAGARVGGPLPGAAKGMSGGEIVLTGSAGAEAAARLRRGLVVVCGDTGIEPGRAMIAGTIVVFGATGDAPGLGNKRGSIVALGAVDVPITYRYACSYRPPHLRLLLTYLQRRYGLPRRPDAVEGTYRRYCGDAGVPGKGEILTLSGV